MSDENVDKVRRVYATWDDDAFGSVDEEMLEEVFHPEIEWDVSRRTFDPGVFRGHEGVREFGARLLEVWESGRVEPVEFISQGDEVVVPVRLSFTSRTHGQVLTANAAHAWTVREGMIVRHRTFQTKAEALEAAGVDPAESA